MEKPIYPFQLHRLKIIKTVEQLFEISLYVLIFLGHNVQFTEPTHSYKIVVSFYLVTGVWLYSLKQSSIKDTCVDLSLKFFTPLCASLIVANITGKVDLSNLFQFFYTVPIVIIYYFQQRKTGSGNLNESVNGMLFRILGNRAVFPIALTPILILVSALFDTSIGIMIILYVISTLIIPTILIYHASLTSTSKTSSKKSVR